MIDQHTLQDKGLRKAWMEAHCSDTQKYVILERQILAFYLLEKLVETEVDFVFKGGTALILLLQETKRFSTDIDILISKPGMVELEARFSRFANRESIFTRFEWDERPESKFPKVHYKFFFDSLYPSDAQSGYILLDAVFEEIPYSHLLSQRIENDILPTSGPYREVRIPSIPDIMMDKLTAFAPNTIGVRFERLSPDRIPRNHSREVVKQWFDVNELYQKCDDSSGYQTKYRTISAFEIRQRGLSLDFNDCLKDTVMTVLSFLSKGQRNPDTYGKIIDGIRGLGSFVNITLGERYFVSASVNVLELVSLTLCEGTEEYRNWLDKSKQAYSYEDFIRVKKLKNIVTLVKAYDPRNRDRLVISLRIIEEVIGF